MSDSALSKFYTYGTNAERLAFVPDPPPGVNVLYIWYETDTTDIYIYDGSSWILAINASPSIITDFSKCFVDATNPNLYGMPWVSSDGTIGTWMGIRRSNVAQWSHKFPVGPGNAVRQEMIVMIKKMMDDAVEKNWEIIIANDEQARLYEKAMEKDLLSEKDSLRMVPDMPERSK